MRKIERQVYFYEVNLEVYNQEKNLFEKSKEYKKDMKKIFELFKTLPVSKDNLNYSMYSKKQNGTFDFVKIDEMNESYIEGKLINSDDSGLTHYEEDGEIKFLKDAISKQISIAEISHFIFFLDTKILAFEYNAKSSHAASLKNYIMEKHNDRYLIEFKNLLNRNKEKRFNSITQVKSFKFTTSSKLLLSENASKKGFFKAASAAFDLTNRSTDVEQNITIEIKPKKITKKNKTPFYDAEELKESINELKINNNESDFKLDIVGMNELNEQIIVNYSNDILKRKITLEPNEIESKEFYTKIHEAYNKVYQKYLG